MSTSEIITLAGIRLEQARQLKEGARQSALIVAIVVLYHFAALVTARPLSFSLTWLLATSVMIGVTLVYARYAAPSGITMENYRRYLNGHVVVTFMTGIVWSVFALLVTDFSSVFSLFIAASIVCSITAGGMFPGSAYRPAFLAMALPTVPPLGLYWFVAAPAPIRFFGLGLLLFFAYGLMSSAKAELGTRDAIIAQTQKRLSEEMTALGRATRKAYEEKAQFLAAASHDLSQPLHAQGYYLEALRRSASSPEQVGLIDKVTASWRAQKRLLEDLVDVTRMEGGLLRPNPSRFDLVQTVEEALDAVRPAMDSIGMTVELDLLDGALLLSDAGFVRRIIANALSNVVKHASDGKVVEIALTKSNSDYVLSISDRGPGVEAVSGSQNALLSPPPALESNRTSGLGLRIIRTMTDLVGAEALLRNRTDRTGAVFTLTLPCAAPFEERAPSLETAQVRQSGTVMIIDDDLSILNAVTTLLSQWGFQTLSVPSVSEAVDMLDMTQLPLDLVITDNRLGEGMDGRQAIEAVRAVTRADLPALVVSGDASLPDKLSMLDHVRVLAKPVDPDRLRLYLNNFMNSELGSPEH